MEELADRAVILLAIFGRTRHIDAGHTHDHLCVDLRSLALQAQGHRF